MHVWQHESKAKEVFEEEFEGGRMLKEYDETKAKANLLEKLEGSSNAN